jgi:hypothetical protein
MKFLSKYWPSVKQHLNYAFVISFLLLMISVYFGSALSITVNALGAGFFYLLKQIEVSLKIELIETKLLIQQQMTKNLYIKLMKTDQDEFLALIKDVLKNEDE